jgi:hypothetical protein
MVAEVTRVLRYPHFQNLYGLSEADLLEYTQFLKSAKGAAARRQTE